MKNKNLTSKDIKTIQRTPDEWKRYHYLNSPLSKFAPNKEIIDNEYDETVAVKCENGTFVGYYNEDVKVWKGIPFAKQPVGIRRFKRAEAPDASDKVFQAFNFGPVSVQEVDEAETASLYEQAEGCLYLNVWSSKMNTTKKPVFVFIHGGGWVGGGTCAQVYNGWNLAHHNPEIIVVTIAYRLGLFGQIDLSDLPDGKEFQHSANNGILDQLQALKWIKKNIAGFGGDPKNITICGESAGGCSVSMLSILKEAKGLFHKVIAMSGGVNQAQAVGPSKDLVKALMNDFPEYKTVSDLQKIPGLLLYKWWTVGLGNQYHNFCLRDGISLPKDPIKIWKNGRTKKLIIMQGATTNEFAYYIPGFHNVKAMYEAICLESIKAVKEYKGAKKGFKKAFADYIKALNKLGFTNELSIAKQFTNDFVLQMINYYQADAHATAGGKGYAYCFDQSYDGEFKRLKAAHAVDLSYLFGNFDGNNCLGDAEELRLSRRFQQMIVNFCKTGNPSIKGFNWKPYNTRSRSRMIIRSKNMKCVDNYQKDRVKAGIKMIDTNDYFRYVPAFNHVMQLVIKNNPQAYKKYIDITIKLNK